MRRRSSLVHAVLLLAAAALPLAASQPWQQCSRGRYTPGSTYETNLLDLISALQENASFSSSSPTLFGFASGAMGNGHDAVYGLMLCRGDVSVSDCYDCGTRAGQDVGRVCNHTKQVILVYNQCYVLLSDNDILVSTSNIGEVPLWNSDNITSADVAGYDGAVTELLNATVRYAVENSTRLFATGQRVGTDPGFRNIYSMAQCSPELSPALCRRCLDGLVGKWWNWKMFSLKTVGARIVGTRCNLRSEVDNPFYTGAPMLMLRADGLPPDGVPRNTGGKNNSASKVLVIFMPIVAVAILAAVSFCLWNTRTGARKRKAEHFCGHTAEDLESVRSIVLSLASLQMATDNFNDNNKLGEGGFGAVYIKGILSGQEVAVKRLAKGSGLEEVKNELILVAKLHHRNLVRLVGFCLEGERLLVYEYMANKSLGTFLFDEEQRKRRDVTNRIVGTFGYMSPEYVMHGQYSTKSDVFSFGILVIEIVTGRSRNNGSYFSEQNEDIISIVLRHWSEGNITEMIDYSLGRNYPESEVLKCVNVGLLCVQQNPVDRPTMADVMVLLDSDATSSVPSLATSRPTLSLDGSSGGFTGSITELSGR